MKLKVIGIYGIYDPFGCIYVGMTKDFRQRKQSHISKTLRAKDGWVAGRYYHLYDYLQSIGLDNVRIELIEAIVDTDDIDAREIYHINDLDPILNIREGGGQVDGKAAAVRKRWDGYVDKKL